MLSIYTRLKNLWKLSEFCPQEIDEKLPSGTLVSPIVKKPSMAQIIKRSNPVEEFLKKEEK